MKIHNDLMMTQQKIEELELENKRMKEDLDRLNNQQLIEWQRRHGGSQQNLHQSPRVQRNSNCSDFQQQQQQHASPHNSSHIAGYPHYATEEDISRIPVGGNNNPVSGYGMFGGAQMQQNRPSPRADEGRYSCPKCDMQCPDTDTLQIHVMDCLDG